MLGSQHSEARASAGRVRVVLPGILVGELSPSRAHPVVPGARSKSIRAARPRRSAKRRSLLRRFEAIISNDRVKVAMLAVVAAGAAVLAGVLANGLGAS
jgi:hypothetical protein